jgi:hypothetical protein
MFLLDLDRDGQAWVTRARATYRLDCDSMQELWEAYCGTDFEEDPSEEISRPAAVADALQKKMKAQMNPLLAELQPLAERVKALRAKKATKSLGDDLAAQLKKEQGRLKRLSVKDVWRGSNHPLTFYAQEYGKQQHESLWSSFSCSVPLAANAVAKYPGSGHTKPDCIKPEVCEVWEFKPDSDAGHKEAAEQISDYVQIVPRYYTERFRKGQPAEAALGGEAIMKTLAAKCLYGDEIQLKVQPHYYKMCEKRYECIGD